MANKVAALLVMCLVLVAAVQLPTTKADQFVSEFASCFKECHKQSQSEGNGSTYCEMKCDTDCVNKQVDEKLKHIKMP